MNDYDLQAELRRLVVEQPRLQREAEDIVRRTHWLSCERTVESGGVVTTECLIVIDPPTYGDRPTK